MSVGEFKTWAAYHELDPWSEERADWRIGMLAATITGIAMKALGVKGKQPRPEDYMPVFDSEPKKPQTGHDMESIGRMFAARMNRKRGS